MLTGDHTASGTEGSAEGMMRRLDVWWDGRIVGMLTQDRFGLERVGGMLREAAKRVELVNRRSIRSSGLIHYDTEIGYPTRVDRRLSSNDL